MVLADQFPPTLLFNPRSPVEYAFASGKVYGISRAEPGKGARELLEQADERRICFGSRYHELSEIGPHVNAARAIGAEPGMPSTRRSPRSTRQSRRQVRKASAAVGVAAESEGKTRGNKTIVSEVTA